MSVIPSPVHVSRHIDATAEKIFDAWLNPRIVRQWLFASPTSKILHVEIDPCINGSFSILEQAENGTQIDHYGKYLDINKPY